MPSANPLQGHFTSGVLSPLMYGRADLAKYKAGLSDCENMFIYQQGPAFRRSGTRYIAPNSSSTYKSRLIPFEYSTIQSYVLEFNHNTMRVFKEEADLGYTLSTSISASDLPSFDYDQSADTLYLTHNGYVPRKITRTGDTSWSISTYNFLDGPYFSENTNTASIITLGSDPTMGGTTTVSCVSSIFAANDASGTFPRHFRLRYTDPDGDNHVIWGKITSYSSGTQVSVNWIGGDFDTFTKANFEASTRHYWRLGSFSVTTGFPRFVTFFEERIVFASSTSQPDTVWMSKAQDLEVFSPTEYDAIVLSDNGVTVTLPSSKVNAIASILNIGQRLLVVTIGGPWEIRSPDTSPLTANVVITRKIGDLGGKLNAKAITAGSSAFYVHRSGRTLYEMAQAQTDGYSLETFIPEAASILAEHLLRESGTYLLRIAFQQEPDPRIWMIRSDGALLVLTYNRTQSVYAFSRITLGGTEPVVEDLAIVPSKDGTQETVYITVKRKINGSYVRTVEFFEEDFQADTVTDGRDSMCFLDCAKTVTGTNMTTVTGLSHLNGETVNVVSDGDFILESKVVSGGSITLTNPADHVVVGFPYASYIKTLEPEAGAAFGTAQAKIKRIDHVSVRVLNSLGFSYGTSLDSLVLHDFRLDRDPLDSSPQLFTGDIRLPMNISYETMCQYYIAQTQPYPLNILALMPEMMSSR